jgi:hypothetical protein
MACLDDMVTAQVPPPRDLEALQRLDIGGACHVAPGPGVLAKRIDAELGPDEARIPS